MHVVVQIWVTLKTGTTYPHSQSHGMLPKKMELGGQRLMECNFISEKESIDNVHERLKAIFPSCRFLLLHILPKLELLFKVKF